jgi:hypothetical protein
MKTGRSYKRIVMLAVVAILAMSILIPAATYASDVGRRNTAIGLAGLSAVLLSNGKTGAGLVAAAGAAVAFDRYNDDRDDHGWSRHHRHHRFNDRDRDRDRDRDHDRRWDRDRDHDSNRDRDNRDRGRW